MVPSCCCCSGAVKEQSLHKSFCLRFLAAASLQGLVQEGTMTSLCIAMTEEQHKSIIIDCAGPQPQLHNAGEITAGNSSPYLLVSLSRPELWTLEVAEDRYTVISCDVRVIKQGECSCMFTLSSFTFSLCVPEHVTGSNRFCEDWMHAFVNGAEGGNPFLFRQILENFKLKVPVHTY